MGGEAVNQLQILFQIFFGSKTASTNIAEWLNLAYAEQEEKVLHIFPTTLLPIWRFLLCLSFLGKKMVAFVKNQHQILF